jgi:hypothetical protein
VKQDHLEISGALVHSAPPAPFIHGFSSSRLVSRLPTSASSASAAPPCSRGRAGPIATQGAVPGPGCDFASQLVANSSGCNSQENDIQLIDLKRLDVSLMKI